MHYHWGLKEMEEETYDDNNEQKEEKEGEDYRQRRRWVSSAKFIAREQWLATGCGDGRVCIYSYATKTMVKEFEAYSCGKYVTSLTAHPTDPLLLTASHKGTSIEFWDWGQGWICTRKIDGHTLNRCGIWNLRFNPMDTSTLASSCCLGGGKKETKVSSSLFYSNFFFHKGLFPKFIAC